MNELDTLIADLHFDKPQELRNKAFNELVKINDDKIPYLIRYKDQDAAEVLREIGYPRVKNYLYELLIWLQDINWPGAVVIADFFVKTGTPTIPYIKRAFKENDSIWHLWILTYVVSKWPYELVKELEGDLIYFIKSFDTNNIAEGVDIEAAKIAMKNNLGDIDDIKNTMKHKNHII